MENTQLQAPKPEPTVAELTVIESKREAWGKMGVAAYQTEQKLQLMAQQIGATLSVLPSKIEDVPEAEKALKAAKSDANKMDEQRKLVTSKLDAFSSRLMEPGKSLLPIFKETETAIITLKRNHEAAERIKQEAEQERKAVREFASNKLIEIDASCKSFMNELISKSYVFALEKSIVIDAVNEYISKCFESGKKKIYENYGPEKWPTNQRVFKITNEEAKTIFDNTFSFNQADYYDAFNDALKSKFSDYETAFANKQQALELDAKEKAEAAKKIEQESLNNKIAASMESAATPVELEFGVDTKVLKKLYKVEMPETIESVLIIMAAFAANKEKCLTKLKINKWYVFTPAQAANALAKLKDDDNKFAPAGMKFVEVDKL